MKYLIIGTAGHVDHGKSALIKALTGTETDRLRKRSSGAFPSTLVLLRYPCRRRLRQVLSMCPAMSAF